MKKIISSVFLVCISITSGYSVGALASESESVDAPQEIIVRPNRTFRNLRHQANLAERKVYQLFNEMNDDDFYDIHCHVEAPKGTRIRQQTCRPEFIDRATREDALAFLEGRSSTSPVSIVTRHYPELEEKMREALIANPELKDAIVEHHYLREELAEFKGRVFDEA